jgi:hypothetical protein
MAAPPGMSFDVNWPFDTDGVTGLGFSTRSPREGRGGPQEQNRQPADEAPRAIPGQHYTKNPEGK